MFSVGCITARCTCVNEESAYSEMSRPRDSHAHCRKWYVLAESTEFNDMKQEEVSVTHTWIRTETNPFNVVGTDDGGDAACSMKLIANGLLGQHWDNKDQADGEGQEQVLRLKKYAE